ncbi:MAG: hypothetical protein QXH73_05310 [Ignisphaera sp.]|uniref:Uncharacterized protein n=1 Tax=Ignisphaera aggregans TaxID=334771 RepID=A0A7C4H583_9CREN
MGVEEVVQIFSSIANKLSGMTTGTAYTLAWIGIILIAIVVMYYLIVALVKVSKAFLNMRVKYLGIFVLLLGLALITIAVLI